MTRRQHHNPEAQRAMMEERERCAELYACFFEAALKPYASDGVVSKDTFNYLTSGGFIKEFMERADANFQAAIENKFSPMWRDR